MLWLCSDIFGLQPCGFIAVLFMKTAEIPADTFTAAHTAIKTDKTYENKRIITFFIITVFIEWTFMLSNCYTNTPVCFHTINTGEKSQTWFTNQIVVCDDTTCMPLKPCDNYLHFYFSTANFNRQKLTLCILNFHLFSIILFYLWKQVLLSVPHKLSVN